MFEDAYIAKPYQLGVYAGEKLESVYELSSKKEERTSKKESTVGEENIRRLRQLCMYSLIREKVSIRKK